MFSSFAPKNGGPASAKTISNSGLVTYWLVLRQDLDLFLGSLLGVRTGPAREPNVGPNLEPAPSETAEKREWCKGFSAKYIA